ncbi:hypothetical protein HO173_002351 [Letharia columbiana]|uniref:Uncharacterized protein n=1 Tax=Letharia columbiana TaxID=112416 RepID=A0A8H6G3G1_9LECA|nr:uncharacterized protein HO173_002351 [Letharia columbiana]KAF6239805.1 hypothetical protein HO173_002351 [Letharia columbiana]
MDSRPQNCYPVVVTESSRFYRDPDDEETFVPLHKTTHIEEVTFSRNFANALAKEYFIRQHCESVSDSNEDDFGYPTPRARRWGIWVPESTTKCTISEVEKRCRIKVVLGSGSERTEFLVEVLRQNICDAVGPLAREDSVGCTRLIGSKPRNELTFKQDPDV